MLIIIEAAVIILLGLIYVVRERKRRIKKYRSGDIIWVRQNLFNPQRGVLCNWDEASFSYIPDESDELIVKKWIFLARNESYKQRQNN
ncbi:hypothetical protein [Adhaeribacter rhizoryzae]|uniref:Uncharacterized protein n=1 Tax=Adhaeribacter rhizoryzae TaxID=2607907 RepID=A0A5M6DJN7_9BACT|nr:hypothetical protein [Adhaeribacter rhizoryzae]KAA5547768.1 hypothetical protein F0145_07420 [Adhaeribacter rhizoryzae]